METAERDIYEQAARKLSLELENNGKLPAGFTAEHYPLTRTERLELQRLSTAWRLAADVDALEDLLLGIPIDPSRVNKDALQDALEASLVQLVRPVDLLHRRIA